MPHSFDNSGARSEACLGKTMTITSASSFAHDLAMNGGRDDRKKESVTITESTNQLSKLYFQARRFAKRVESGQESRIPPCHQLSISAPNATRTDAMRPDCQLGRVGSPLTSHSASRVHLG